MPSARGRVIRAASFCESFGPLLTRGVDLGHQSLLAVQTLAIEAQQAGAFPGLLASATEPT